jgi:hypothetical protein
MSLTYQVSKKPYKYNSVAIQNLVKPDYDAMKVMKAKETIRSSSCNIDFAIKEYSFSLTICR